MSKTITNITGFNFDNPDIKTLIINTQVKDFKLFEQFMDISINDNGRDIIIKELYKRDPLLLNELYNNNMHFHNHSNKNKFVLDKIQFAVQLGLLYILF